MDRLAFVTEQDLLTEIRVFLAETGMKPSYFGKAAAGNSELVGRLEAGRTVTLQTVAAVHDFIAKRRANLHGKQAVN